MPQSIGKYIMAAGIILIIAGALIYFSHGRLKWFGNLPGDIRIERDNFRFYLPLTTMIILSILITIIVNIIKKLF